MRIDVKLVEDKIVSTRSKALNLIKSGSVQVNGVTITKAGLDVGEKDKIEIVGKVNPYISKGGLKLEKAINEFGVDFGDKVVIDIGSSTGGFTDCALKNGAKKIYAIDVGNNQLDNTLRQNSKVVSMENTDFRSIQKDTVVDAEIIICDASFISLTKLLPKICELGIKTLVVLIKPQFECGIEIAKKFKGVIRDKKVHYQVLQNVLSEFKTSGYYCEKITFSPITGGDGNIEYVALFNNYDSSINDCIDLTKLIESAFLNFGIIK